METVAYVGMRLCLTLVIQNTRVGGSDFKKGSKMNKIPEDMVVPQIRQDISKIQNVAWLLRNLGVHHQDHPEFTKTIEMLKQKMREAKR